LVLRSTVATRTDCLLIVCAATRPSVSGARVF